METGADSGGEERWSNVATTRGEPRRVLCLDPRASAADAPWPVCLILADMAASDAAGALQAAREVAREPLALGWRCCVTSLAPASPGNEQHDAPLADRAGAALVADLLARLGAQPGADATRDPILIGLGRGGTLAFLAACTSARVGAIALLGAPLVYRELGPDRPVQPLELALNLGCPCLLLYAQEDPRTPAPERERARTVLSQFSRSFDIVTLPGPAPWSRPEAGQELGRFLRASCE